MKKKIILTAAAILLASLIFWGFSFIPLLRTPTNVNVLHVGTTADFPPFAFIQDGRMQGFDIDLAVEIARRIGKEINVIDLPFCTLIPELNFDNIQLMIGGISKTELRAKQVLFTQPYIQDVPLVVVTLAKNKINSIDDLKGHEVAVNDGYTADLYMSDIPGVQLQRLPSVIDGFMALQNEHVYAFVSAQNTISPFFKKFSRDKFNIYVIPDTAETCALAIAKDRPQLLAQVNKSIDDMKQDGTLDNLKKKWNLSDD